MQRSFYGLAGCILLMCVAATAQHITKREGLRGHVRSALTEEAPLILQNGVSVEQARKAKSYFAFDTEGNSTELAIYNSDGSVRQRIKQFYENGKPTGSEVYNGAGKLLSRTKYTYDDAGRMPMSITYDPDGKETSRSVLPASGDKSNELIWRDVAGNVLTRRINSSTEQGGERVEIISYNQDGTVKQRDIEVRDARSQLIEVVKQLGDGSIMGRSVWTRNADGSVREQKQYSRNGSFRSSTVYENKMPVTSLYNADGTLRLKEYSITDETDAYGNWTKQTLWWIESDKTQPVKIIYRTLTYY